MSYLDLIKQKSLFKIEKIDIQGNTFYLRELSIKDKVELLSKNQITETTSTSQYYDYFCDMVFKCLCDDKGNLTETEESVKELKNLLPDSIMGELVKVCMNINGLTQEAKDNLKNE